MLVTLSIEHISASGVGFGNKYINKEIELAGDILTPQQMANAFSKVQQTKVIHKEVPPWIFLLFLQKELYNIIQFYRNQGYQADVDRLREEFPRLLTTFAEFLQETDWGNAELSYETMNNYQLSMNN